MKHYHITGFIQVLAGESKLQAEIVGLQSVGIGVLRPNSIVIPFPQLHSPDSVDYV